MKRVFRFKQGDYWEWDCELMEFIDSQLSDWRESSFPRIKQTTKITVIVEKEKLHVQ